MRGQAYLKLNKAAEAALEFQKILNARGQAASSVLYPLAHLGLARAAQQNGDPAKARESYEKFFVLWKEADTDLSALLAAKKESERVK